MAMSGFSLLAFSMASRPFAASPTTFQPRGAWRRPRIPRRTSSWSSATKMHSFFPALPIQRYRHAHHRAAATGINIEPPADKLHSLLHAGDANSQRKWRFSVFPVSRNSTAAVAYFQCDLFRVADNPYFSLQASRMPLHVRKALLDHSKKRQLRISFQPSELRRNLQFHLDSSPFRESPSLQTHAILLPNLFH